MTDKKAENILHREFEAYQPNEKWTTDVTEFKIPHSHEKLYLSAFLDLYEDKKAENILHREFEAYQPNEKWTTDVTEFKIPHSHEKLYLSAFLDLYDRSILAWVVSNRNDNILVFDTFKQAIALNPDAHPLFHSDRGYQYTSLAFQKMLKEQGMTQSMSRVACCLDNGPTEGLWGIIKTEMYRMYDIHDKKSLIEAIGERMTQSMSRVACCLDNGPTEGLWGIIKTEMYRMYDIHDKKSLIEAIGEIYSFL